MRTSDLDLVASPDGSAEVIGLVGAGTGRETVRIPVAALAGAGSKPTPEELKAAILATLVNGENIELVQGTDGTVAVKLASSPVLKGTPRAPTAAAGTGTTQIATTAFVAAAVAVLTDLLADKQGRLLEGTGVDLVDNGDGTFTLNATGGGSGGGAGNLSSSSTFTVPGGLAEGGQLTLGYKGATTINDEGPSTWSIDVSATNALRVFRRAADSTILTALTIDPATGAVTIVDEAYGATWSGKATVPTKGALYAKLEALATAISGRVATTAVGAANGVAPLDASGKVPAANLPSYVDDVLEFSGAGSFPNPGEAGKIYVAADTGKQSRWTGTQYAELTASPGTTDNVPEGNVNRYYTDVRVRVAPMTGLVDAAGTPQAADALLTVLNKLRMQAFTTIPNAYLAKTGGTVTGLTNFVTGGSLLGANNASTALQVFSDGDADGSFMSFHRRNRYAIYLGLDVDNYFRLGGFSSPLRMAVSPTGAIECFGLNTNGNSVTSANYIVTTGAGAVKFLPRDGTAGLTDVYSGVSNDWRVYQNGADRFRVHAGGIYVWGDIASSSDRRLKDNIRPLEDPLALVRAMEAVRFEMDGREQIGLVAQDVREVIPEVVTENPDGMLGVDYGRLTAALIGAVRQLEARVAKLEARP